MWWRPEPSSVSPIYMPGRLRTASRPFSTLIDSAPYSEAATAFRSEARFIGSLRVNPSVLFGPLGGRKPVPRSGAYFTPIHRQDLGLRRQKSEGFPVGSGHPGLGFQVQNLVKKGLPASVIQMRRNLIEEDQGRGTGELADQPRLGEHETEQKRLLLA